MMAHIFDPSTGEAETGGSLSLRLVTQRNSCLRKERKEGKKKRKGRKEEREDEYRSKRNGFVLFG